MLTLGRQSQSDNEEVKGLSNLNTPGRISAAVVTKLGVTIIYHFPVLTKELQLH